MPKRPKRVKTRPFIIPKLPGHVFPKICDQDALGELKFNFYKFLPEAPSTGWLGLLLDLLTGW